MGSRKGKKDTNAKQTNYAIENKGACVQNQDPQMKSATGTGTLFLSVYSGFIIFLKSSS